MFCLDQLNNYHSNTKFFIHINSSKFQDTRLTNINDVYKFNQSNFKFNKSNKINLIQHGPPKPYKRNPINNDIHCSKRISS